MQRNFATPIIIPPIAVGTLSGPQYRWVASSDWTDVQTRYFAQERFTRHTAFIKFPKLIRKKPKEHQPQLGQWVFVLRSSEEAASAWAEAQLYPSGFPICQLYLGGSINEELTNGITLLVSAIFAGCDCDLINIWGVGSNIDFNNLKLSEYGVARQVCLLDDNDSEPRAESILQVTSTSWKETLTFKTHESSLQNLVRKKYSYKTEIVKPRKRKRSLISRIFNPWN